MEIAAVDFAIRSMRQPLVDFLSVREESQRISRGSRRDGARRRPRQPGTDPRLAVLLEVGLLDPEPLGDALQGLLRRPREPGRLEPGVNDLPGLVLGPEAG